MDRASRTGIWPVVGGFEVHLIAQEIQPNTISPIAENGTGLYRRDAYQNALP